MKLHDYFDGTWTDTRQPNSVEGKHFVTTGCSHTGAIGLYISQGYTQQLAHDLKMPGINLSRPGGNHQVCAYNVTRWIRHSRPEFVIAQWPHPVRKLIWRDGGGAVLNVHTDQDTLFDTMLRYGEENFYCEWIQSILTITTLCEAISIPCVHWTLDEIDYSYQRMLRDNNIVLHSNDKDSNIWNRDNGARDQRHHSAKCHTQWAQKLKGLLNENTAR
jgi:hypothetical protein